ncbi:PepSY-associated TM helix domain-containing protein [Paraburkholderia sp. Ac-20347]|uniref:PepSY-associated TM helix domain-containing protein n=1 Tax=Paraburkholderia sp. Ac-20347 TaxID=2703892 RepID=UPI00197F2985|nr:PepSY-associated TM helix domain-containing protein [Paraburkholderia sp. Ac-20347]MBN3810056.1 PepSY domain-containing protein [Paraburkholderia sp. Ac-20347]
MTRSMRIWLRLHTWSSLVCTLFLLVVCVTGLPLIFLDEISEHWRGDPPAAALSADTPIVDLDRLVASAVGKRGVFPGETVRWLSIEDDTGQIWMGLGPSYQAARSFDHVVRFDARSGQVIHAARSGEHTSPMWIGLMFRLHTDGFAGLYGELFLAAMALLFVLATISGVALYCPFMKKLSFGTVRSDRSRRVAWLDVHNLLGIVTVAWVLSVGVTGVVNQLSTPLYDVWRNTALKALLAAYRDQPMPSQPGSVQAAYETALRAEPGKTVRSIRFPDGKLGSPYHYLIWIHGDTPLTSQLATPVLVDARTGQLTAKPSLPWYLTMLLTARPLHFGDYAGLPLKVIWALLDLFTITVLSSGLYLWIARRKSRAARVERLLGAHESARASVERRAGETQKD